MGLLILGVTGCTTDMEALQAKQTPASLDPFVAEEITQQDRTSPTKAKSQELFARASDLPTGPQEVIFYSRRQETLSLFSKWSGISRTDLAELNGIADSDKELPVNTPLTISLTADDLDRETRIELTPEMFSDDASPGLPPWLAIAAGEVEAAWRDEAGVKLTDPHK